MVFFFVLFFFFFFLYFSLFVFVVFSFPLAMGNNGSITEEGKDNKLHLDPERPLGSEDAFVIFKVLFLFYFLFFFFIIIFMFF